MLLVRGTMTYCPSVRFVYIYAVYVAEFQLKVACMIGQSLQ